MDERTDTNEERGLNECYEARRTRMRCAKTEEMCLSHCVSCVIKQKISAYRRSGRAGRLLHGNGTRQVRVRSGQACVWRFGALPSTLGASFCFFLFCFAQYGCCIHAIPGFLFSMQVHMKNKEVTQVFNTVFLFFTCSFVFSFFFLLASVILIKLISQAFFSSSHHHHHHSSKHTAHFSSR